MKLMQVFALLMLLCIGVWPSPVHADDPDDAKPTETIVYAVSGGDARELMEPLLVKFERTITLTPLRDRNLLVIELDPKDRTEVLDLLRELDRPPSPIRVSIYLLQCDQPLTDQDVRELSGQNPQVVAKIRSLQESGAIEIANQVELTVLENLPTQLHIGESVPLRSQTTMLGPGRQQHSYDFTNFGTAVNLLLKTVSDQVVLDLNFERSMLRPAARDDDGDGQGMRGTTELTHESTLRIADGNAVLVAGISGRDSSSRHVTSYLVIGVDNLESSELENGNAVRSRRRSATPAKRHRPGGTRPVRGNTRAKRRQSR